VTSSPLVAEDCLHLGTSTLFEASKGLARALDPGIRPVWNGAAVCGPAYPVACVPGDNLAIQHAVELAPPGSVLVVDAAGLLLGHWGEVLSWAALVQGIRGLVIDGGVRDIDSLEQMGFPVFARGVSMKGTVKKAIGSLGTGAEVGGVAVNLGDLVVADRDGVMVLPATDVDSVLSAAHSREAHEREVIEQLKQGGRMLDLFGWRGLADPDAPVGERSGATGRSVHLPGVSHKAPIPAGAKLGQLFFSSGISGKDPETGKAPEHVRDEARHAFANMAALVREAGGDIGDIAQVTVFLKDRDDKAYVDESWLEMFPDAEDRPARHAVKGDGPQRLQLQIVAVIDPITRPASQRGETS
jgi:4-hydroxy-4-methyl-2-oxoglutarate aldolase